MQKSRMDMLLGLHTCKKGIGMLKGRESLIRLIGRRRRFLRRRRSLLLTSSPPPQAQDEVSSGNEEWVDCPVCGNKVPAQDTLINSHLDKCLARGTKRKLSQYTLFQLKFCTRPKVKVSSIDSDFARTDAGPSNDDGNVCDVAFKMSSSDGFENNIQDKSNSSSVTTTNRSKLCAGKSSVCDKVNRMENVDGLIEFDDECEPLPGAKSLQNFELDGFGQHKISDDWMPDFVEPLDGGDNSRILLDTFIVGRRFGGCKELTIGAMIVLSRDPGNVKDPNAIKVLTKDTDLSKELGFIPRELAQYLSPLIDKFHLSFEKLLHHSQMIVRGSLLGFMHAKGHGFGWIAFHTPKYVIMKKLLRGFLKQNV